LQRSYGGKRQTDQKRVTVVESAENEGAWRDEVLRIYVGHKDLLCILIEAFSVAGFRNWMTTVPSMTMQLVGETSRLGLPEVFWPSEKIT